MKRIVTKNYMHVFIFACFVLFCCQNSYSQITTSAISGKIVDKKGEPLPGVTVVAQSTSTGANSNAVTGTDGRYNIINLSAGETYKVTATMVGFDANEKSDIYLSLGVTTTLDLTMEEKNTQLNEVVVVGNKNTNSATTAKKEDLQQIPTISRSITDFTRLAPQSSNNSFAGANYRYNNVAIDGAINNDAIGFSPSLGGISGTSNMPGSSTRTNPISLDALQEVQAMISPFDIKLGNFTGGSINAVTRSGSNEVTGSVYTYGTNASIVGTDNASGTGAMSNTYYDSQSGLRLGFPIVKNKLFFFVNGELDRKQQPVFYEVGHGALLADSSAQHIVKVMENLPSSEYNPNGGFNPGTYDNYSIKTNSDKVFARLDYIINDKNRLMIRNNYNTSDCGNLDNANNIFKFSSMDYIQHNNFNTTVAELRSTISNNLSNSLVGGYTNIHDFRDPVGTIFPQIQISNVNGGTVYLGTDREAAVFNMKQQTTELTDNLTWFLNKNAITFGTHNEMYDINYGFVNSWNGRYDFSSLNSFYAMQPSRMRAFFNLSDDSRDNNLNNPAAIFKVYMLSLYAQDEMTVTDRLKVNYGVRMDATLIPSDPLQSTLAETSPEDKNYGTTYTYTPLSQVTNKLFGKPEVSPRVGFNYDINGNKNIILRGGTGLFTGRIPFAWLGYSYYNNGVSYGAFDIKNLPANTALPTNPTQLQAWATDPHGGNQPNGRREIDLVDNNFKLPEVWRSNLATDFKLPAKFVLSLEAIFTKTIEDVQFKMVNLKDSVKYYSYDVNHQQPIYLSGGSSGQRINTGISNAYMLTNTTEGYSYNFSVQLKKSFNFGLQASAAYTYGVAEDIWNGIRNSPESNWQLNQSLEANNPQLAYSNFDIRHRIISSIMYKKDWNKKYTSYVSLFFTAQSGSPFTYTYSSDITNSGQQVSLCYIPKASTDIELAPDNASDTRTPATIWAQLNNYIENNSYLNSRRGEFTERNGARTPWNNDLDLRLMQDFNFYIKNVKHTLTVTFDVINLTNLIDKKWGWAYFVPNTFNSSSYTGMSYAGVDAATGKTIFHFDAPTTTPYSTDPIASRWQGQVGLRYTF